MFTHESESTWLVIMGSATGRCIGDIVPPTFEAKVLQWGTMKMMYSSQFRLYSGVHQGNIMVHLLFNIILMT